MKIQEIEISKLRQYEKNPRRNDNAVPYVANSIKEFGFKVPIVVDRNNVIVAGHTRVKAAEELGMTSVPCVIADDLTDAQVKAFRLADNKTAEFADWDFNMLDGELGDLSDIGVDMSDFGFGDMDEIPNAEDFGTAFALPSGEKGDFRHFAFQLHNEQAVLFDACIDYIAENGGPSMTFGNNNRMGNAVYEVMKQWAELKNLNLK